MDLITRGFVREFLQLNEIITAGESTDFEKFCCHCILSKEYNAYFNVEDILTDSGTKGIDGFGLLVNGKLIDSLESIVDLIENNRTLEATFVFIQTKTSSHFDGGEIGNFFGAVKDFFSGRASSFSGEKMKHFGSLRDKVYENSPYMTKGNPICKLFYVSTGNWENDPNLIDIIERNKEELKTTNLFSDIVFEPCDAKTIQKYYRKTKEKVQTTFSFEKRVTLPVIDGVQEAYFGIVPFNEFKKIISDESDHIRSIFYDNIRDFLGDNDVNEKIENTLKLGKFDFFSVLNNGVTVVADKLQATGDKFTVNDYQVVNGCQTSHVLFNNKNLEGIEALNIPFRLIVTDNDDIKNEITKATNSQTAVKQEELEALSEFQKNLEKHYNSIEGDGRLYYERRTNQYNSDNSVYKTKIITIPIQIKAFSAMFLENPHSVSGYYGTIAKKLGQNIFKNNHKYSPYYTSGLGYYRLESLFRAGTISAKYKQARYHLLMLYRLISNSDNLPDLTSKKMDQYCEKIIETLNDPEKSLKIYEKALRIIDEAKIDLGDRDVFKRKEETDLLISKLKTFVVK